MKNLIRIFFAIAICASISPAQKADLKDVLAKHRESIVSPSQKTRITNLTAVGESTYTQGSNHQRPYVGKSVIASDGRKLAVAMTFPLVDYAVDRILYDGKKLYLPFTRPGVRSALNEFLFLNDEIVKEGMFGGALSTGWALLSSDALKGSLSLQGTKKIDGKDAYALSYSTKVGSGLAVKIYLDVATGRHIRTEYRRTISATMGATPETSASKPDTIEEMTEDFGDFKTEAGVTLPTSYKIRIARTLGSGSREFFYEIKVATFYYNQELDPATFEEDAPAA